MRGTIAAVAMLTLAVTPRLASAQRNVAVAASSDDRVELFYAHPQAGVYHTWQTSPTEHVWAPWKRYEPSPESSGVVAAKDSAGRLSVAWLVQGSIWVAAASAPGSALAQPRNLGTVDLRALTSVVDQDGRIEFLALNGQGQLWSVAQSALGTWDSPNVHFLEGHDLTQFSATSYADGRIAVVALGADHRAYWRAQTAPNSGWAPWSGLDGEGLQELAAGANADGRLEVTALGGDGALYHRYQNANATWSTWEFLVNGPLQGPITMNRNADGRLEVFARRSGTRDVVHIWQKSPNATWTDAAVGLPAGVHSQTDDQAVALVGGRLTLVTANKTTCMVAVAAQTQPNANFEGWPALPTPCPPPPPAAPKVSLKADPDYLAVGKPSTISWSVANCQTNCDVSMEGRNDLNYSRVFVTASALPAQDSRTFTFTDTFSKITVTARNGGGSDTASVVVQLYGNAPACAGCMWFYFKMKPPSSLYSCANVSVYATSEAIAKQMAEAEWTGYSATAITYSQFVAGCQ